MSGWALYEKGGSPAELPHAFARLVDLGRAAAVLGDDLPRLLLPEGWPVGQHDIGNPPTSLQLCREVIGGRQNRSWSLQAPGPAH